MKGWLSFTFTMKLPGICILCFFGVLGNALTEIINICSLNGQVITLDGADSYDLRTPADYEAGGNSSGCTVQFDPSPGRIVRMTVHEFDLAGQDPCNLEQEYLSVNFPGFSHYARGEVDRIVWCGQTFTPIFETRRNMRLSYLSGPAEDRGEGFRIFISLENKYHCGSANQSIVVGDQPVYLYSPGFPDQYDNQILDCVWNVTTRNKRKVLIDSPRFALESHGACNYDYLQVKSVKYCGYNRVQASSLNGESLILKFVSDHKFQFGGFILKFVESPETEWSISSSNVTALSSPTRLLVHQGYSDRFWVIHSGSNDSVVLLEMKEFHSSASCDQLKINVYDGPSSGSPKIVSGCGASQPFQTVRGSSNALYLSVHIQGRFYGNILFAVTRSPKDPLPRILYASRANSFVWVNILYNLDIEQGILIRGDNEDPGDYGQCIHLKMKSTPQATQSLNASDYCRIYSGWNSSFAELGQQCGQNSSNDLIISRGSQIYLKCLGRRLGPVWLNFKMGSYCEPPTIKVQSRQALTTVTTSQLFKTRVYPNNAYCRWLIEPDSSNQYTYMKVTQTGLYGYYCNDNITVYDYDPGSNSKVGEPLLTVCDSKSKVIYSSRGHGLLVDFSSDYKYHSLGPVFSYSSASLAGECPSIGSLSAEAEAHELKSPNYPYHYPNNLQCQWRITAPAGHVVNVTFLYLNINGVPNSCSNYDYLVIFDGVDASGRLLKDLCGDLGEAVGLRAVVSSGQHMYIKFQSDARNSAKGFRLQYFASVKSVQSMCNREVHVAPAQDRFITSPFYPSAYPSNTHCYWLALAPRSNIVMLAIEELHFSGCSNANVSIYDGDSASSLLLTSLCGAEYRTHFTSSQQAMYITFNAVRYLPSDRFKFRLRSWTHCDPCMQICDLIAHISKKSFNSPRYPDTYPPGSSCTWRLVSVQRNMSVQLDVVDIQLETSSSCDKDFVAIYDGYGAGSPPLGRVCADQAVTYWSSGVYMFVQFVSDDRYQYKGFLMEYKAVSHVGTNPKIPDTATSNSDSATGVIVGGAVGGIIFLVASTVIFIYVMRRFRQRRPRRPSRPDHRAGPPAYQRNGQTNTLVVISPVIVNQLPPPAYSSLPHTHPPYPSANHLPPPPAYKDLEAPPAYSDAMLESYPPTSPGQRDSLQASGESSGGGSGERSKNASGESPGKGFGERPQNEFGESSRNGYGESSRNGFGEHPTSGFREHPRNGFGESPRNELGEHSRNGCEERPRYGFVEHTRKSSGECPRNVFGEHLRNSSEEHPRISSRERPRNRTAETDLDQQQGEDSRSASTRRGPVLPSALQTRAAAQSTVAQGRDLAASGRGEGGDGSASVEENDRGDGSLVFGEDGRARPEAGREQLATGNGKTRRETENGRREDNGRARHGRGRQDMENRPTRQDDRRRARQDGYERARQDDNDRARREHNERARQEHYERARPDGNRRTRQNDESARPDDNERARLDDNDRARRDGNRRTRQNDERASPDDNLRARQDGNRRVRQNDERARQDDNERARQDCNRRARKNDKRARQDDGRANQTENSRGRQDDNRRARHNENPRPFELGPMVFSDLNSRHGDQSTDEQSDNSPKGQGQSSHPKVQDQGQRSSQEERSEGMGMEGRFTEATGENSPDIYV